MMSVSIPGIRNLLGGRAEHTPGATKSPRALFEALFNFLFFPQSALEHSAYLSLSSLPTYARQ